MKTYLVSYDLIRPESSPEYTRLINLIKTATNWAKPLESVWFIKTDLSSMDIVNKLRAVIDANDKLLVIEVTNDWTSFNVSKDVAEWMRKGL